MTGDSGPIRETDSRNLARRRRQGKTKAASIPTRATAPLIQGGGCAGLWHLLLALGVLTTSPFAFAGKPPDPAGGAAGGAGGPAAGGSAAVDAATAKRLAALRKKVLKDEDFVENDETNRDPFHSYIRLFVDHGAAKTHKVAAVFDKVALDELSLIAIISGDETPRAMFRDATGFGQAVKKGEFLSRAAARVTKILSDRVIVEISETTGSGETRVIEKAILVNPGEAP